MKREELVAQTNELCEKCEQWQLGVDLKLADVFRIDANAFWIPGVGWCICKSSAKYERPLRDGGCLKCFFCWKVCKNCPYALDFLMLWDGKTRCRGECENFRSAD